MKKTYQIKMNQGKDSKVLDVTPAGTKGQAVTIKAEAGARYQLVDTETNYGPENIRASRQGKDLKISFEGSNTTDLVIEDYYKVSPEGYNGLIGEAEGGKFYEYIPESASGMASVPMLAESGPVVGMALGGAEVAPAGAAVGVLAAGLFSPWLVGAGALGAAAAAGGGGGGDAAAGGAAVATAPVVKSAYLMAADDSGPKDNVTNIKSPRITGEATANSDISVTVGGKTYTGKADANGIYAIPTEGLTDGSYSAEVTATSNGLKSAAKTAVPFTVDTSQSHNYLPDKTPDPNSELTVIITSISEDTGLVVIDAAAPKPTLNDFRTKDSTLVFNGSLSGFTKGHGDWVELVLKDATGKVVASDYVQPTSSSNGTWTWSWDKTAQVLSDGQYKLEASIIDGSGNQLKSTVKDVFVDTSGEKNGVNFDLNSKLSTTIDLVSDGGIYSNDFIVKGVNGVVGLKGVFSDKFDAKNGDLILLQVIDTKGFVVNQKYLEVSNLDGKSWSFDGASFAYSSGVYVAKMSILDACGNIVNVAQQSFTVDRDAPAYTGGILVDDQSGEVYQVSYKFSEDGVFKYKYENLSVEKFYKKDAEIDFSGLKGMTIDKNKLEMSFQDVAGNFIFNSNGSGMWFNNNKLVFPANFKSGAGVDYIDNIPYKISIIGEVGVKKVFEPDFDMATLYHNIQTLSSKDPIAVNKVDMLAGDHTLHVTMGDVLALGVKNSFVADGNIQLLIDGDAKDVLNLDNLVGSVSYDWKTENSPVTSGGHVYQAYTNDALGIEVLVQKDIVVHLV